MNPDRLVRQVESGPQLERGEGQCRTEKRKECRMEGFVSGLKKKYALPN